MSLRELLELPRGTRVYCEGLDNGKPYSEHHILFSAARVGEEILIINTFGMSWRGPLEDIHKVIL